MLIVKVTLDMETLDFSQTEFSSRLLQIPQEKSQEILFNNFCWRIVIVNVEHRVSLFLKSKTPRL